MWEEGGGGLRDVSLYLKSFNCYNVSRPWITRSGHTNTKRYNTETYILQCKENEGDG